MSLVVGTVTVADDESASGTGAAYALYVATVGFAVDFTPLVPPTLGQTTGAYRAERPASAEDIALIVAARVGLLRYHAKTCRIIAGLLPYIVAHAELSVGTLAAHVTTQSLGEAFSLGAPIAPPASPVDIPLTGAGSLS